MWPLFFCPFSAKYTVNQAVCFTLKSAAFFVLKNFLIFFVQGVKKWDFSLATYWGTKQKTLEILENRIHIQQVHSRTGAKAPAEWRCATNFLPVRVITESKVGSDSEPFWNIRLLRIRRWNDSGIMILPYGAGGEPGRGETPMSSVSSRTPVDFLLRIWGMRSN